MLSNDASDKLKPAAIPMMLAMSKNGYKKSTNVDKIKSISESRRFI